MVEVVAIAYVVDASLALASDWGQALAEYILPLLHRLGELHANPHFRLGVVTYGPAETRPSPLLGKHFFAQPQVIIKELREEPERLGLGLTSSGGSTGMAALEGLVAALELFDVLKDSIEVMTSHIIHVAAAPPDGSERPVWNLASNLDDVSWETLPLELRKRNINYSSILLNPVPRFSELSVSAAVGPTQQPWFPVKPQHALHLSGFPATQQKGAKRGADGTNGAGRAAELKRPKVEFSASPPPPPADTSPPLSHPSQATAPASVETQLASQPPRPAQIPNGEYMAQLTNHVQNKRNEIEEHKRMGRVKEAADGERDYGKLLQFFRQAQVLFQKNPQSVPPSQSQPAALNNSGVPRVESSVNVGSTGVASMLGIPSTPAVTGVVSTTNSDLQTSVPHLLSTDHTGEMAHMPPTLPEPLPALHTASTTQTPQHPLRPISANSLPPANASSNGLPQTSPAATNVRGTRPPTASQGGSYSRVWDGPVTWVEPTSGRPLQAHMAVNAPDVLRAFPWPPTLTLEPSTEFRVNMPKLQDWLRGHANQYSILLVTSHSPTGDPKQNEERHGLLWRSIFQSHRYAVVSFLDHSGMVSVKRLLLFPARPGQFAGALFRGPGGIPELPPLFVGGIPVTQVPPNLADILLSLTPQQSAELEKLSNSGKQAKLQEYARNYRQMKIQEQQRLLMMQQAQQSRQQAMQPLQPLDTMPGTPAMAPSTMTSQPPPQQQSPPSTQRRKPIPPNNLNTLIPVNPFLNGIPPSVDQVLALGGSTPQASTQIPGRMSSAAPNSMRMQGMHGRVPSGGGSTNVPAMGGVNLSHEMMQSFMQRRQDGSSGMGGATDGSIGGGMGL